MCEQVTRSARGAMSRFVLIGPMPLVGSVSGVVVCDDPAMVPEWPAEINNDEFGGDSDFITFLQSYSLLRCP